MSGFECQLVQVPRQCPLFCLSFVLCPCISTEHDSRYVNLLLPLLVGDVISGRALRPEAFSQEGENDVNKLRRKNSKLALGYYTTLLRECPIFSTWAQAGLGRAGQGRAVHCRAFLYRIHRNLIFAMWLMLCHRLADVFPFGLSFSFLWPVRVLALATFIYLRK